MAESAAGSRFGEYWLVDGHDIHTFSVVNEVTPRRAG
jgi:hypothetical protein